MAADLSTFLSDLLNGETTVAADLRPFDEADKLRSTTVLLQFYERTKMEMPSQLPAFNKPAALWAAQYLYRAFQLLLLRHFGEEYIEKELTPYSGEINAEAIYSVDLTFRQLPLLLTLAKRLAPGDPLVTKIKEIAILWPFSSVSCELNQALINDQKIVTDPCLSIIYADKIIEARDTKRAIAVSDPNLINSVLGIHAGLLWPGFELLTLTETTYGQHE